VKLTKVRNSIFVPLLLTESFIFQWPKECVEIVGHPVRHKTPESNKSHRELIILGNHSTPSLFPPHPERHGMRNVNARLLSLENWMRTFMVSIALVAIGVAIQITWTLVQQPSAPFVPPASSMPLAGFGEVSTNKETTT
jgi:hypothetical protein